LFAGIENLHFPLRKDWHASIETSGIRTAMLLILVCEAKCDRCPGAAVMITMRIDRVALTLFVRAD
jgi:hypothetical protein